MATVTQLLQQAIPQLDEAGVESPRLDAELLLAQVLGRTRGWLWAYGEQEVTSEQEQTFRTLVQRRRGREPLAYLLGEWEFYGRPFFVTPDVLIPRPETELLVEAVLEWAGEHAARRIIDVGTGSGAIAVTLAAELPGPEIVAIDLSPTALAIAQRNAERNGVAGRITWLQGDLLQPAYDADLPPVDAIVANLPYIAEEEMAALMPEVRDHEPRLALQADARGLALIHRLIDESPPLLVSGGLLALEVGMGQAEAVAAYLTQHAWHAVRIIRDYADIERHVLAEKD